MYTVKKMYPSGEYIDFLDPTRARISIEDIAWSLSMQCRFGGGCSHFYSVAQHSLFVANLLPAELALQGLMHDAHEAYVQDIVTGFKRALGETMIILDALWSCEVRMRYGLPTKIHPDVHHADMVALATERRDLGLMDNREWPFIAGISPQVKSLQLRLSQPAVYKLFLNKFEHLGGGTKICR